MNSPVKITKKNKIIFFSEESVQGEFERAVPSQANEGVDIRSNRKTRILGRDSTVIRFIVLFFLLLHIYEYINKFISTGLKTGKFPVM